MKKTIYVVEIGIFIALYIIFSVLFPIPLINHIHLDLGYIVLGVCCCILTPIQCGIIACVGCTLESVIVNGWIPHGWLIGNFVIGYILAIAFKKDNKFIQYGFVLIATIIGILVIKTVVECLMFNIPLSIKLISNGIATLTDCIVLWVSIPIGYRISKYYKH